MKIPPYFCHMKKRPAKRIGEVQTKPAKIIGEVQTKPAKRVGDILFSRRLFTKDTTTKKYTCHGLRYGSEHSLNLLASLKVGESVKILYNTITRIK
jgi:hypothetical protein